MASSGNFSTMNPLNRTSGSVVYTNGNLSFSPGSSWSSTTFTRNNMYIPKDKKIYFELYHKTQNGYYAGYGFGAENAPVTSSEFGATGCITTYYGDTRVNGTRTTSQFTSPSQGDIIQFAIDGSNNKVWFGINNTWVLSGDPANGSNEIGTITTNSTVGYDIGFIAQQNAVSTLTMNFGQDSTFAGDVTAGGNADANGFGDFKYAPPTGFLALCSGNLSVSDDIDPAQTDDDYPSKQFGAVLYTGNGGSNAVTGLGFQPDLVWGKCRSHSQAGILIDSSRGQSLLFSSLSNDEQTSNGPFMTSYDSDGFTLASSGSNPNDSGRTYVAWGWRANGGTTASNSDGDITSTVQANTKAGFSIVQFTSNNTANQTVGHGLGAVPKFILVKPLTGGGWSWWVYHIYNGTLGYFRLQDGDAFSSGTGGFGAHPTSSVFTMGAVGSSMPNNTSTPVIAYCWADVEGSSKFGIYTGNANADGPFVYTGFRPKLVAIKKGSGSNDWVVTDTARNTGNPASNVLRWDDAAAESSSNREIDLLSNGFKPRTTNDVYNGSGGTYAYMAWGDVPFKYNNTF
jgi:hypothetical protein